jgi:hypothetical protein
MHPKLLLVSTLTAQVEDIPTRISQATPEGMNGITDGLAHCRTKEYISFRKAMTLDWKEQLQARNPH